MKLVADAADQTQPDETTSNLAYYSGHGGSGDAHIKDKDKYRIQNDVDNKSYAGRKKGGMTISDSSKQSGKYLI